MKRAAVVGGGLAGLSAGYRLHRLGWEVTVFESLGRVGGRVWSESENGFLFDLGPTIVTDGYSEYMKLVADVGLSDQLVDCPSEIAVAQGNNLHIIDTHKPLRSFLSTKLLSPTTKLRLLARGLRLVKPLYGMNPYDLRNRVQYDTESIESYVDRVFGRELNEAFFEGVTRSMVTSTPGDASVVGFLAGAVTASGKMQTLTGGLQRLPIKVAAELDVRLNSPVRAVRRTDRGVEVRYQNGSGTECQERADACVIATPFGVAADLYPPLQGRGADMLKRGKDTGCSSVQLTYSRPTEKQPFLVMVPAATAREISSLYLDHVKAPDRAPAGTSLITAFFPHTPAIDLSTWSDDRLTTTTRELIERMFPELRDHFVTTRVTRWTYAANEAKVGYYKALQRFLDNYPADEPVQVAGDYMALPSQESAVVAGVKAARKIHAAQSERAAPARAG
ncbi:NAD(P)/FAD-dependent oxidoreductase [Mycobacterium sp. 1245852.3]|uniref:protoporphyrinogen/coproporphyrinogen oxidase n=1 Tax=Mycobacterium sp. 1245852.3 TaxID=1856860 RepID=UPI0009EE691B|nr:NAD(P)/FAD-dependent oxidoreductase [Mycobacterium sp. 1245852.3]